MIQQPQDASAAAAARFGRAPNIVMILMDDVGYGDFGAFGGGVAVGSPTPISTGWWRVVCG